MVDLRKIIELINPNATNTSYSIFTEAQVEQLNRLIMYSDYYENNVFKYIELKYPESRLEDFNFR